MVTLPTYVTLFRVALTPCIVWAIGCGLWGASFFFFCLAAFSDLLDGALARSLNLHSALGACLDALADKFLIISVFSALAICHSPFVPFWLVVIILIKELILISGAVYVGFFNGWSQIRPSLLGKFNMCVQVVFIVWIFLCGLLGWVPFKTSALVGFIVSCLAIGVLAQYAWIALFNKHKKFEGVE